MDSYLEVKRKLVKLQRKPCCKYWIEMWMDVISRTVYCGTFRCCPECGEPFNKIPLEMEEK